jgi:hypothetical protein
MLSIKHPGKYRAPSARMNLSAAGSSVRRINFFTSTLSAVCRWAVTSNRGEQIKRSTLNVSARRTGRNLAPIVRQFLLLFGEGEEASPPGVEGDFSRKAECIALVRCTYDYDYRHNGWGTRRSFPRTTC